jgi:dTDP-4-amino-4,6-dideoxygalactose transaminase
VDKYTWVDIGSSFLPGELSAAFLYAQLEQAKRINAHRRTLYGKYLSLLEPLAAQGLFRLPLSPGNRPENGHIFYLLCRRAEERSALIAHLQQQNLSAVFHYVPLHDSPAGQRFARTSGSLAVTEDLAGRLLRLPLYSEMTMEQVRRVCLAVQAFYQTLC